MNTPITDSTAVIDTLWTQSLQDFLSATASAQPTPGGGSVAGVTAACGLGLVVMALEISGKRKDVAQPAQINALLVESRQVMAQIAGAADADIAAFRAYMAALKLPKDTDDQKRQRAESLQAAVIRATESPLQAARFMVAALHLATRALPLTHPHVLSDVGAGAGILEGALKAVLLNVDINLPGLRDAAFQSACGTARVQLAEEGSRLAAQVLATVARGRNSPA